MIFSEQFIVDFVQIFAAPPKGPEGPRRGASKGCLEAGKQSRAFPAGIPFAAPLRGRDAAPLRGRDARRHSLRSTPSGPFGADTSGSKFLPADVVIPVGFVSNTKASSVAMYKVDDEKQ